MTKKRLALTEDGVMTYCTASEENMGKGRCNHVLHGDPNDMQGFMEQIKHYNKNYKLDESVKSSEESLFIKNAPKHPVNTEYFTKFYEECYTKTSHIPYLKEFNGYDCDDMNYYDIFYSHTRKYLKFLCTYNLAIKKLENGGELDYPLKQYQGMLKFYRGKSMRSCDLINIRCQKHGCSNLLPCDGDTIEEMDPKEFDKSIIEFFRTTRFTNC